MTGRGAVADWQPTGAVDRSGRCTLDANGAGTITFQVRHANEKWECEGLVLTSSQAFTAEPYPMVVAYDGAGPSDGHRAGGSFIGNFDTLSGAFTLDCGTDLTVQVTGGIPGVIVTARVTGKSFAWR